MQDILRVEKLWWEGWGSNPLTVSRTGLQPAATLQLRRPPGWERATPKAARPLFFWNRPQESNLDISDHNRAL